MNKGKFIVIEGIDGAGKGTQTELLVERLKKENREVVVDDYPHYETSFWGKHVGRMLSKEFGNPMEISSYLTVLPYILDEADGSKKIIEPALEKGMIVISNRYFTSNVHQIAKRPENDREIYANWLWEAGYNQMGIKKPDLVLVLLVDPPICRENILKKIERNYTKGQAMDAAEEDFNHQMESAKEYKKMADKEPDLWVLIDCCRDGKLLPKEEIHNIIFEEINKRRFL
ncbi:MAG: deoxynucleoside kinase [Candidatus Shapirobacteria bacterium]|nr:deoxynucleoside kinase [Candidatus Shapirobacteria bacterium]MDD3002595.1 deoxynucleoside kinase [Candidatus Shapirobacteria bacterium]MDD4382792.1 deoxynucleoside kinase [Candidatus Shapirobacteria bacterium]